MTAQLPAATCRMASWMLAVLMLVSSSAVAQEKPATDKVPATKEPATREPAVQALVDKVLQAAGGEAKLLKIIQLKERFNSGKERAGGTVRESVIEAPNYWWLGTKERGAEPAKITTWAWTLGILVDTKSTLALLPDITDGEQSLVGLRVSASVTPDLDMYFDKTKFQLQRIDWRNDIYRFSQWKEADGAQYPSVCVMYRRKSGEPWFHHEIVELKRLTELPAELKRPGT